MRTKAARPPSMARRLRADCCCECGASVPLGDLWCSAHRQSGLRWDGGTWEDYEQSHREKVMIRAARGNL
jgi:hypothetical protein